ncbi:MAG: hypothetical protein C0605_05680 [Hyphomicrobiales bacterium]|nr:MAG: hypothetical protein C0605_05680 [Hyphomicrobiales bacterium]
MKLIIVFDDQRVKLLVANSVTDREAPGQARRDSVAALRLRVVSKMEKPVRRKTVPLFQSGKKDTAWPWASGDNVLVSDLFRNKY